MGWKNNYTSRPILYTKALLFCDRELVIDHANSKLTIFLEHIHSVCDENILVQGHERK